MGYRTYIGKISKTEWEKLTDLSREELYKLHDEDPEDGWVSMTDLCKPLYELGKYTEFDDSKFYTPFFRNKETQEYYNGDHDFHIVGKDFFEHVIKHYSDKVRKYYEDMLKSFWNPETKDFKVSLDELTPEYKKSLYLCIEHCRSMGLEWGAARWARRDRRGFGAEQSQCPQSLRTHPRFFDQRGVRRSLICIASVSGCQPSCRAAPDSLIEPSAQTLPTV
jgi:hypothetical protein